MGWLEGGLQTVGSPVRRRCVGRSVVKSVGKKLVFAVGEREGMSVGINVEKRVGTLVGEANG